MRIAYFDCFAGASGDMILGALVDAGLSLSDLTVQLGRLPLGGYRLLARQESRGGLCGVRVIVEVEPGAGEHRSLAQIVDIISSSTLSDRVKQKSSAIFERLAAAEARVHHADIGAVHFHEVGAVDAIVDVVGAVVGLDLLGVEACYSSALPGGGGTVVTEHGVLPVPAPATLELLAIAEAPIRPGFDPQEGEVLTPTAAAIITILASFEQSRFSISKVGYGVGSQELPHVPNVLRVWLGEMAASESGGGFRLLETNIDDMSPEVFGYVMERLFQGGAADVWFTPIQMKKNRPAVMLSVLAPAEAEAKLVESILRETSTLGIRVRPIERREAERQIVEFQSSLGRVAVKIKRIRGVPVSVSPEFEDCCKLALERNLPLSEVFRVVTTEASAQLLPK